MSLSPYAHSWARRAPSSISRKAGIQGGSQSTNSCSSDWFALELTPLSWMSPYAHVTLCPLYLLGALCSFTWQLQLRKPRPLSVVRELHGYAVQNLPEEIGGIAMNGSCYLLWR